MYDHLILVTKEHMIGSKIANLIYTEVRVRASKQDNTYIQNEDDYEPLVERELNDTQIENFKANRHLYNVVEHNEFGVIYQFGTDFKKMYWSLFPKNIEPVKEKNIEPVKEKKERTHKVCSKCKKELPVTDFYLRQNKQLFSRCKKCVLNNSKLQNKKLSLQKSI